MKARQAHNIIKAIKKPKGTWISDPIGIKKQFISFFEHLFSNDKRGMEEIQGSKMDMWLNEMPTLTADQINMLNRPFSKEEIKEAMFSMKPNTSPGPDGILPSLIQQKWDIMGEDYTQAALNFLEGGHMLKETNHTFIALIPKTERPEQVSR